MEYIYRVLEQKLTEYLSVFPVVGLAGPRQSGKSTLIQHLLGKQYSYVTFDDPVNIRLFSDDPVGFINDHGDRVIFDEAQKVPEIFSYLKMEVDNDRQNYGKYVVTGSAQFNLLQQISESLAGRIGLLTLLPFEYCELPEKYQKQSMYLGQYPELIEHEYKHFSAWYGSYISTYIEKDVRAVNDIGNLRDFNRLIHLLATQITNPLNYSEIANKLNVSATTIKRWVSILEASYIIFLLPPYYENYGKRITKAPKVYFYDTGLASYFTGIETEKQFKQGPMSGAIFENYIIAEFLKRIHHRQLNHKLYYLRTNHGVEIDLIIDKGQSREFIEIKQSATFNPRMTQHLQTIRQANPNKNDNYKVLYNGKEYKYQQIIIRPYYQEWQAT